MVLDSYVYTFVLSDSNTTLSRTKRAHTGRFSIPNKREKSEADELIEMWVSPGARGTNKAGRVFNLKANANARIDLQGPESSGGVDLERYAVQIGTKTFSVVHIEVGKRLAVPFIQEAFSESMKYQTHVFIASQKFAVSNTPKDNLSYSWRQDPNRRGWIYSASGL